MEEHEIKEFSFSVPMKTTKTTINAEEGVEAKETPSSTRAVALIGDRFYHGAFVPAVELEKAHKGWENTLHDISHMGTTHIQGLTATSDILYFVGYIKKCVNGYRNRRQHSLCKSMERVCVLM